MPPNNWYEISGQEVNIYGDIGWEVNASEFANELAKMDGDIEVRILSNGGQVVQGLAIYNAIKRYSGGKVTTYNDGLAASMGSIILMAGETRVMSANALMMIHNAQGGGFGEAKDVRKAADIIEKHSARLKAIYVERTGLEESDIQAMMDEETWMDADEALAFGFVDEIGEALDMAASYDLSRYQRAPKAAARFAGNPETEKVKKMPIENGKQKAPEKTPVATQDPQPTADISAQVKAQVKAAKERVSALYQLKSDYPEQAQIIDEALEDDTITVGEVNGRILRSLKDKPVETEPEVTAGEDESEKRVAAASDAILARAGVRVKGKDGVERRVDATGSPFAGLSLREIARDCAAHAGVSVKGMDPMTIVGAAFTHSTSDFPIVLENVMHKTLRASYEATPDTWRRFCATGSVSDFRAHNRYQMGTFGDLELVGENGEFKHGTLSDAEKHSITAVTKGKLLNVSRQMVINDDLGAFLGASRMMGRAAARTVEKDVYALFALNSGNGPTMSDSNPLFHADHNNIDSSGAAPTTASFETSRQVMASQQDKDSNDYLDLRPAIWLGPITLGAQARVVNEAQYDHDGTKLQKPNVSRGLVNDVVDTPRLTGAPWYFFADPMDEPVFEVAFLDGNQTPFLDQQEGFTVDGVLYKVRLDYAAGAIGWRGVVKNPGT